MLAARLAYRQSRLGARSRPVVSILACASVRNISSKIPVPNISKVWESVDDAVKDVKSGDTIVCGGTSCVFAINTCNLLLIGTPTGFGLCGTPGLSEDRIFEAYALIDALRA